MYPGLRNDVNALHLDTPAHCVINSICLESLVAMVIPQPRIEVYFMQ